MAQPARSPSWISRTRSVGRMNRRSWVTTTSVQPRSSVARGAARRSRRPLCGRGCRSARRRGGRRVLDQGPRDRRPAAAGRRESLEGLWRSRCPSPTWRSKSSAFARHSGVTQSGCRASRTLPTAVRLWIRLNCWKTKPSFSRRKASWLDLVHGGQVVAVDGDRPGRRVVQGARANRGACSCPSPMGRR